jgi:hypothetical protein
MASKDAMMKVKQMKMERKLTAQPQARARSMEVGWTATKTLVLNIRVLLLEGEVEPTHSFDLRRGPRRISPQCRWAKHSGAVLIGGEAVTVWLGGAGYLSLWESVEGQMEAQVGEHVMSHLWLFLVLFRVSEAVFLEEKIVASDVISQIIIYIFK